MPVNPEDPTPKAYVDNIPPENLTYFRLSENQIVGAGNPSIYAAAGDVGLGNLLSGNVDVYSRAPFPMKIIRMGLTLQSNLLANYSLGLTAPYVMNLNRFNPPGSDPPFVNVGTATLPVGSRTLDADVDINLGVSAGDV